MNLTAEDRSFIRRRWAEIRDAQAQADKANVEWKSINRALNEKYAEENRRRRAAGRFPHTALGISQAKSDNLALSDALATGKWHSANAERLIADVMLFLRLKELEIL
jgi:hypothetical protein